MTLEAPPSPADAGTSGSSVTTPSSAAVAPPVAAQSPGATSEGNSQSAASAQAAVEKLSIMGVEIDKSKVPSELLDKVEGWNKSYTEKSQRLTAAEKKAQALDQLANDQAFRQWYWERVNGKPGEAKEDPYALTPERQAELLSDPKQFRDYIEGLTKVAVDRYAVPAANQARAEAMTLRNEQTVSRLATEHKDFDQLNNEGKIEEVVAKYAQQGVDIDLEDAYWLAKRPFMESEAEIKAQQRVAEKVNGSTTPPSGAPPAGIKIVSGKGMSFEDKMRTAFEHNLRGEKIKFGE